MSYLLYSTLSKLIIELFIPNSAKEVVNSLYFNMIIIITSQLKQSTEFNLKLQETIIFLILMSCFTFPHHLSEMSNERFFLSNLSILILLLCSTQSCTARNNSHCSPSSCGNITISYPFRLQGDPTTCGHADPIFPLECQKNQTILRTKTRRYRVQAITYSNFSMRISDPGLDHNNYSSCPVYYSVDDDLYSSYMYRRSDNIVTITFLNCLTPVTNPLYIENPFCRNISAFSNSTRIYSYVSVGDISVSDLEESCTYDTMAEASSPLPLTDHNYSYSQIHDLLAYGFEGSWYRAMCTECDESKGTCTLEKNKIRCRHYCYEDTPFEERSFICKLEYYGVYLYLAALTIGGLIALRFVIGIPYLIGLVVYRRKKKSSSLNESEINEELTRHQANLISYSYGEIIKMTRNFKAKLGEGPHGTVFRGNLRSGPSVAVTMLINSTASDKEFVTHVSTISRISHPNITKLIGFCIEGTKRALVNEFMQCGSLEKHIFLQEGTNPEPSLRYREMFKISLGIARGIECLHGNQMFNLGIKPRNILLDEDFNPKISDSGLAKLYLSNDGKLEAVNVVDKGKMGFIPPEMFYKNIGEVSCKADVYSFGMLVLEMAARLRALNPYADKPGHVYFPSWIYNRLSEGKELDIGDADEEEKEMVKKMIVVASRCIPIRPGDRPLISEVVGMLEGRIELLRMPPMRNSWRRVLRV